MPRKNPKLLGNLRGSTYAICIHCPFDGTESELIEHAKANGHMWTHPTGHHSGASEEANARWNQRAGYPVGVELI